MNHAPWRRRASRAALLLAVAAASGCRSYDGPSFAGEWVESDLWRVEAVAATASATTAAGGSTSAGRAGFGALSTLALSHDRDAILDASVRGALVDSGGRSWSLAGEPEVVRPSSDEAPVGGQATGVTETRSLAMGWAGPLALWSDQGEGVCYERGPVRYALARGRLRGQDVLTLRWGRVGRFLWSEAPAEGWHTLTFVRASGASFVAPAAAPPGVAPADGAPSRCEGCGEPLEARWRVCPVCGRPRS